MDFLLESIGMATQSFNSRVQTRGTNDPEAFSRVEEIIDTLEHQTTPELNVQGGADPRLVHLACEELARSPLHSVGQGRRLAQALWRYVVASLPGAFYDSYTDPGEKDAWPSLEGLVELFSTSEDSPLLAMHLPVIPEWPHPLSKDSAASERADRAYRALHEWGPIEVEINHYDLDHQGSLSTAERVTTEALAFSAAAAGPYLERKLLRRWESFRLYHEDPSILARDIPPVVEWPTPPPLPLIDRTLTIASRLIEQHKDYRLAASLISSRQSLEMHISNDQARRLASLHDDVIKIRYDHLIQERADASPPLRQRPTRRQRVKRIASIPLESKLLLNESHKGRNKASQLLQAQSSSALHEQAMALASDPRTSPAELWLLHLKEDTDINAALATNSSAPEGLVEAIVQERGHYGSHPVPHNLSSKISEHPQLVPIIMVSARDPELIARCVDLYSDRVSYGQLAALALRTLDMVHADARRVIDALLKVGPIGSLSLVLTRMDRELEGDSIDLDDISRALRAFMGSPEAITSFTPSTDLHRVAQDASVQAHERTSTSLTAYLNYVQRVNSLHQARRATYWNGGPPPWDELIPLASEGRLGHAMFCVLAALDTAPPDFLRLYAVSDGTSGLQQPSDWKSRSSSTFGRGLPIEDADDARRWLQALSEKPIQHDDGSSAARKNILTLLLSNGLDLGLAEPATLPELGDAALPAAVRRLFGEHGPATDDLLAVDRWIRSGWVDRLQVAVRTGRPNAFALYRPILDVLHPRRTEGRLHDLPAPMARWLDDRLTSLLAEGMIDEQARMDASVYLGISRDSLVQVVTRVTNEAQWRFEELDLLDSESEGE
ncbi:hypothetical protein ACI3ET_00030 [Ornithinimicrobium sp. LYQ121]|uniref:hypothetical protein n=1 Tax=Ornithinimicrobium sp. LYQ121 TaxID=3378801 RepID=UPI003852D2C7